MKQIRLAWNVDGYQAEGDQPQFAGQWMDATFENRRTMKIILEAGLETMGPDTHWIETRDVPDEGKSTQRSIP